MRYLIASPVVLAWTQVLIAMVAGFGMYVFVRRVLGVGFWPAAIVAWCYPLAGTYIVCLGAGQPPVACWLPWLLCAVHECVRRPLGWGGPALAAVTAVVLLSGQTDIGGQSLLTAGLFAVACWFHHYGRQWRSRPAILSAMLCGAAWAVGILASLWLLLPLVEYTQTGARIIRRTQGEEERPPKGLSVGLQLFVPDCYGTTLDGSWYLVYGNLLESPAMGYAGLLATLVAAPLAWRRRTARWANIFWIFLIFVAVSWQLNIPGMVSLLRMHGLNLMSHNRFVFVVPVAVLAMAAVGLDVLWAKGASRRWWFALPVAALVAIAAWAAYRSVVLPEPVATELGTFVTRGGTVPGIANLDAVERVQHSFTRAYGAALLLAVVGIGVWIVLWSGMNFRRWWVGALGILMLAELLRFDYGFNAQCDPAFYYPRIPVLEELARQPPGRILGYGCFPPELAGVYGLRDIRGYDAVDPLRLVDLLELARRPDTRAATFSLTPYALTQYFTPQIDMRSTTEAIRLPPVLDMLGVRYVLYSETPPQGVHPCIQGNGYWVMLNPEALPRVFVPRRVEIVDDARKPGNTPEETKKLLDSRFARMDFDPREVAYVESPDAPLDLPPVCRGNVTLDEKSPTCMTVSADMETPGLVVLADLWDVGWRAYLNGRPTPILRTDHALRGVRVGPGKSNIEFRYEPSSLAWGARLSALAALIWLGWAGAVVWGGKTATPMTPAKPVGSYSAGNAGPADKGASSEASGSAPAKGRPQQKEPPSARRRRRRGK